MKKIVALTLVSLFFLGLAFAQLSTASYLDEVAWNIGKKDCKVGDFTISKDLKIGHLFRVGSRPSINVGHLFFVRAEELRQSSPSSRHPVKIKKWRPH
jgi:hypothetical protein